MLFRSPELAPYKSLDAKRLKLVGTGAWPMADFLSGPLWLPFQEPRFLLHGPDDDHCVWPALHAENREENLELAKIWDARGLLRLHKFPLLKDHFLRVFNAFKNSSVDRQIGTDASQTQESDPLTGHPITYLQVSSLSTCVWSLMRSSCLGL